MLPFILFLSDQWHQIATDAQTNSRRPHNTCVFWEREAKLPACPVFGRVGKTIHSFLTSIVIINLLCFFGLFVFWFVCPIIILYLIHIKAKTTLCYSNSYS